MTDNSRQSSRGEVDIGKQRAQRAVRDRSCGKDRGRTELGERVPKGTKNGELCR